MLSIVRRMVRSKFMLVVIGLLMVGLAGMGLPDMFSSSEPRGMISAGNRFVVKNELDRRVDDYLRNVRQAEGQNITREQAAKTGVVEQIFQAIANETALLAFADGQNIRATRFAMTEMVAAAPRFKHAVTGKYDEQSFVDFANQQGLTVKQLEKDLIESFTREYIVDAVRAGVHTPDSLGKVWMTSQSEQRKFSYVKIDSSYQSTESDPTDEEVLAFYTENKSVFTQPERKAVSILSVSPRDFIGEVEIADEILRDEYDLRIRHFSSPETREINEFSSSNRRLVQQALDEIGAGALPENVLSALTDLNTSTRLVSESDIENEEYSRAVFNAPKDGHLGVIELTDGIWTGVVINEIYPGTPTPFETVSDQIFQELAVQEAEKLFESKQEEFFDLVGGGFELEEAADALGVPLMKFDAIDNQGRTEDGHLLGAVVFRPESMETLRALQFDGETSDIMDDVADGHYVIRLDNLKESYVPELAEIKELATESFKLYQASQAADKAATELLNRAEELNDLKAAANEFGFDFVKSETPLNRRETPEGVSTSMAYQLLGAKEGSFVIASEQDGSRAVLHLEEITNLEPDMLDLLAASGKRAISETLESDIESAFVEAIIFESEVEVNARARAEYINSMAGLQ